jgi:membrane protein YdbS with pleckstrin-like domain
VERKVPVIRRVNRMLGLINTSMLLLFIAIMLMIYYTAHNPASPATLLANRAVLVLIVLIVVVPLLEVVQVSRMIRRKVAEEAAVSRP